MSFDTRRWITGSRQKYCKYLKRNNTNEQRKIMARKNCNVLMCIMIKIGNMLAKSKKKNLQESYGSRFFSCDRSRTPSGCSRSHLVCFVSALETNETHWL